MRPAAAPSQWRRAVEAAIPQVRHSPISSHPLEQVHAGIVCPVGADAADPLGKGSHSDELAREWSKTRHRIRLSSCIDNSSQGGCRF